MRTGTLKHMNVAPEAEVMKQFTLDRIRRLHGDERAKKFRADVEKFTRENSVPAWVDMWSRNDGTALDTYAWDQDQDFGEGLRVDGAMGPKGAAGSEPGGPTRGLLNAARLREAGINLADFAKDADCCVVGAWCGFEVLLLHGMGAKSVSAVEEVPEFAKWCKRQMDEFGVTGEVLPKSLYDIPREVLEKAGKFDLIYCPGVVYHLSDPACGLAILRLMLKPGGVIMFEGMANGNDTMMAEYRGPSIVGWNWYVCSGPMWVQMTRDVGFENAYQADFVDGRFWVVGNASDGSIPLLDSGAAGFARTDILDIMRKKFRSKK